MKTVSKICHKYSTNNDYSLSGSIKAIEETLKESNLSLSHKYIDYALGYFFKDFGLGTSEAQEISKEKAIQTVE